MVSSESRDEILKWTADEAAALKIMKERLKSEIASVVPFPDIVGDRRLIRFLRGRQGNVEEAIKMYQDFIKWRKENDVDDIRFDITYSGYNHPYRFPNGKKIIDLCPTIGKYFELYNIYVYILNKIFLISLT